jgi:PAS domain S-box-containing protein
MEHPKGVDDDTWLDVIQKMDDVYSQLLRDEVALEEKNAQLEASQQLIYSLLSSMSDVLVAADAQGLIEQTNQALCELVGCSEEALLGAPMHTLLHSSAGTGVLQDMMRRTVTLRQGETVELMLHDAAGQPVPVDFTATPRYDGRRRCVGYVFVGRPMADIKRAYRQLHEAHEALKLTQQQRCMPKKCPRWAVWWRVWRTNSTTPSALCWATCMRSTAIPSACASTWRPCTPPWVTRSCPSCASWRGSCASSTS